MNRLMALVPAVLLTTAAFAQEAPEAARMDLWCGIAFNILASGVNSAAPPETQALAKQFVEGAAMLLERATTAHLQAGYDQAGFVTYKAEREAHVAANMAGPEPDYDYKYEDCTVLIGL